MLAPRRALAVAGLALALLALYLPRDWYDHLPKKEGRREPPMKGVTLLQICMGAQGLALIAAGMKRRPFARIAPENLPPPKPVEEESLSRPAALGLLAGLTAVAAALRFYKLNSDLWFDEITTVEFYRDVTPFNVVMTYINSNNHLLNTLLMKASLALFGESEWTIRLPAVLFGVATVPLMYWLSRRALSRRASLSAAGLLAVSYHHVFFSQNARGYTAFIFFSLLASGLLVDAMREDRPASWAGFVAASVLNFASLLNSAFVVAGHAVAGAAALWIVRRRGRDPIPLAWRLFGVFLAAGLLGLMIYATVIPQVMVFVENVYQQQSSGYNLWSLELLQELARGLSAGFGPGLLLGAIPFVALAAWGFFKMLRRHKTFTLALTAPLFVTAAYLVARGFTFSPRFFILALPAAILAVVYGVFEIAMVAAARIGASETSASRGATVFAAILGLASLASMKGYYERPKQDYRGALAYLAKERKPGDPIVAVYLAERGIGYYAGEFGLEPERDFAVARSIEAFDAATSKPTGDAWAVTTFQRALKLDYPDIMAKLRGEWREEKVFPGTMGDGAVKVWRRKKPGPS